MANEKTKTKRKYDDFHLNSNKKNNYQRCTNLIKFGNDSTQIGQVNTISGQIVFCYAVHMCASFVCMRNVYSLRRLLIRYCFHEIVCEAREPR